MKNKFSSWLLILFASLFTACSSDSSEKLSEEDLLKQKLNGEWVVSQQNMIYSVLINSDGGGMIDVYEYVNKLWEQSAVPLQYTLSGERITLHLKGSDTPLNFTGFIAVTGNSLSFRMNEAGQEQTFMLTRNDNDDQIINKMKQDIEENWIEVGPEGDLENDQFFQSESTLKQAIAGVYNLLRKYEYEQLNLEEIRITGKDLHGIQRSITSNAKEIGTAWETAYKVISNVNLIIDHLTQGKAYYLTKEQKKSYLSEATLLRCFTYYNMARLWGKIPYITKYTGNPLDSSERPILTQVEIYSKLLSELSTVGDFPTKEYYISPEVAKVLKAEIKVWLGDREQAKSYLQNCHVDFKISIDSSETEYYKIFGDKIINYSDTTVKLLLQELNEEYDTLLTNWKSHESKWGYWDMLKRTKKAMDVTGCKEYELLMPIPNDEIMFDPNQSQNPGY